MEQSDSRTSSTYGRSRANPPSNSLSNQIGEVIPVTTSIERALLDSVSLTEPWPLIERFAQLTRVSGSADEEASAEYIQERLTALGVPFQIHRPELFLSIPGRTQVMIHGPEMAEPLRFHAKTPSFSISTAATPAGQVAGPGVFVPTPKATGIGDLFAAAPAATVPDVSGRVAVTHGLPMPAKVAALAARGALAAVFISPGERIHEGICTTVWGTPDLTSYQRQPAIPVASIARSDGNKLEALLASAGDAMVDVSVRTELTQGWHKCPLVVAEIPGTTWPAEFVLLHGHLDSWHVGIGDNAVGNAALLEIARVLWQHRAHLQRSVRIAWWPGHSTGRYAGSTWYADQYGLDIRRNCIVHLNCDSPGCRWADTFADIPTMPETDSIARAAIRDAAGLPAVTVRPERAGDLSFSNIGVSTMFMLSSTIAEERRAELGLYAVGGCGGNNEWHTEDDTLPVADRANLQRDIRVYALAVWRAANGTVHPLDLRATAAELHALLAGYRERVRSLIDLAPAVAAASRLSRAMEDYYAASLDGVTVSPPEPTATAALNARLRRVARMLVSLTYSQAGEWRQDPALPVPPLPELAAATTAIEGGEVPIGFVRTDLVRAQNRIIATIDDVLREIGAGGE